MAVFSSRRGRTSSVPNSLSPNDSVATGAEREFDRQIGVLLARGYPALAGIDAAAFAALCEPLRGHLPALGAGPVDAASGRMPFVVVVSSSCVPAEEAMTRVVRARKPGVVRMHPVKPADFLPILGVAVPDEPVYLLTDFARGDEYRNETPEHALSRILHSRRSPLTIEEGIAVLTQAPEVLVTNHCFSLLASRRADQRVPALWLSEGRPKLGWCWDRNPHTWLGSAFCAERLGRVKSAAR